MAASLHDVQAALDRVAGKSGFRCVPVSWEDAERGTVGGVLSCWGGNISDVRLWEKSGKLLYTLRSENWNERLGYVASRDVAVVTSNEHPGGGAPLTPVTLRTYLREIGQRAAYAGIDRSTNLFAEQLDEIFSIRFQTVFLPIAARETVEFCTETYNYNTHRDDDPRNLLLLCTPQGTSVQQDGAAAQRVYYHAVDSGGVAHRYWLEAERSDHKVGGAQVETAAEAADAAARGKATATRIGTRSMGTRFNVQMLIQVPLKQSKPVPSREFECDDDDDCLDCCPMECEAGGGESSCMDDGEVAFCAAAPAGRSAGSTGVSNAARVSRGSEVDVFSGVLNKEPQRDPSQHGTITVTMYYTVAGGVPCSADVEAAVSDLDALYKGCPSDKRLVDCTELTRELTVSTANDIAKKLQTQPYAPPPFAASEDVGFPL